MDININEFFLREYAPADNFYTSKEEIEMINEELLIGNNLKNYKDDDDVLLEIRNKVVTFYINLQKTGFNYKNQLGMMSVTAVIDLLIYS